jgi:predicted metalloendopeptidase
MSIYGYFLIFAAYIIFGLNAKEWQYPEIHLNYSIDPCEDLYEHVCSIWKHNNPVPSDRTAFSKLARAAEQIKPLMLGRFYDIIN